MNTSLVASIEESILCWLATVDEDGMPNVSPKEVFTLLNNEIIIANIASPESAKNIALTGKACVSFINVFSQKGYKVKGKAKQLLRTHACFNEYYAPLSEIAGKKFEITSILSVAIESVSEIVAPSYRFYPGTSEVSQIESAYKTYGVQGRVVSGV